MNFDCFTNSDLSPVAFIKLMFEKIDADNTLLISGLYFDDVDESDKVYRCEMSWSENQLAEMISEYESIYKSIKGIADSIITMNDGNTANIEDECEVLYKNNEYAQANGELMRAKRLCKLLVLHAPEIVINNEARQLAQAMVLNRYCKSKTVIDEG